MVLKDPTGAARDRNSLPMFNAGLESSRSVLLPLELFELFKAVDEGLTPNHSRFTMINVTALAFSTYGTSILMPRMNSMIKSKLIRSHQLPTWIHVAASWTMLPVAHDADLQRPNVLPPSGAWGGG
jgi:hypothetical protein